MSDQPEEDAVDKQIKAMQERFARLEKVEGAAEKGDVCTIDFVGKVDDVALRAAAAPAILGVGQRKLYSRV